MPCWSLPQGMKTASSVPHPSLREEWDTRRGCHYLKRAGGSRLDSSLAQLAGQDQAGLALARADCGCRLVEQFADLGRGHLAPVSEDQRSGQLFVEVEKVLTHKGNLITVRGGVRRVGLRCRSRRGDGGIELTAPGQAATLFEAAVDRDPHEPTGRILVITPRCAMPNRPEADILEQVLGVGPGETEPGHDPSETGPNGE